MKISTITKIAYFYLFMSCNFLIANSMEIFQSENKRYKFKVDNKSYQMSMINKNQTPYQKECISPPKPEEPVKTTPCIPSAKTEEPVITPPCTPYPKSEEPSKNSNMYSYS